MAAAGRFSHMVTIQKPVETKNSLGEVIKTWGMFSLVWAAVEPIRGREYFDAETHQGEVSVRILIRYLSGVTEKMRVSYDGRLYNIESVIDKRENHRVLELMCSEGLNNG